MNMKEIAGRALEWATAPLFANVYVIRLKRPVRLSAKTSESEIQHKLARPFAEAEIDELPQGTNHANFVGTRHTYIVKVEQNDESNDPNDLSGSLKIIPAASLGEGVLESLDHAGHVRVSSTNEKMTLKKPDGEAQLIVEPADFDNQSSDIVVYGAIFYRPNGQPAMPGR